MTGNYSMGEKLLLANAGVQNADPAIRAELSSDDKQVQGSDASFTDRVLGPAPPPPPKPVPKKSDDGGGWFDWF